MSVLVRMLVSPLGLSRPWRVVVHMVVPVAVAVAMPVTVRLVLVPVLVFSPALHDSSIFWTVMEASAEAKPSPSAQAPFKSVAQPVQRKDGIMLRTYRSLDDMKPIIEMMERDLSGESGTAERWGCGRSF